MGIKVTATGGRAWRWIMVECPDCNKHNAVKIYFKPFGNRHKGKLVCHNCGVRLHWEGTEDES